MSELLAYDADGNVVATLGHMVARDAAGNVIGLIDFDAHEAADGEHTDIWRVSGAKGSKVWPEWLGAGAHDFRVELAGKSGRKHIAALVHKESGHRRERAAVEAAIAAVPVVNGARDIRHLVGGPTKPLALDAEGRTAERLSMATPAHLPLV
jgi:hypothetical protein